MAGGEETAGPAAEEEDADSDGSEDIDIEDSEGEEEDEEEGGDDDMEMDDGEQNAANSDKPAQQPGNVQQHNADVMVH